MAKKVTKKEVVVENAVVEEVVTKDNAKKKNTYISIQEVTDLYAASGIKCHNPNAKGNYRIMGNAKGSSLNVKPTKGYYIYTTDADFAELSSSGIIADDLVLEEATNSQDHSRPNTVICKTVETLKSILAVYAMNPLNKLVVEVTE